MRAFNWEALLQERRIPYVESGANVKRGEINIRCPWCGNADPSHHMGLSRETGWYSCWRNRAAHSGKSPVRLIMQLLGVPYGEAREIAGLGKDYVDPEGFDAFAARLLRSRDVARPEQVQRRVLRFDADFWPVEDRGRTRAHYNYLLGRDFDHRAIEQLGREYGVCAGTMGAWGSRVILPYYEDQELVTWTGRAIGHSHIRYRDLELEQSICAPKATLFNHDSIYEGGVFLVLVEGPIDALKLDLYGKPYGIRAVALSTNSISEEQVFLLQGAASRFTALLTMMDNATALGRVDTMRMRQELSFIPNVRSTAVPYGAKDAGALTGDEVARWADQMTSKEH